MTVLVETRLEELYDRFKSEIIRFKGHLQADITDMAAGAIQSNRIVSLDTMMGRDRGRFNAFAAVTGMQQYVKNTLGNQSYDNAAEISALSTAITAAIADIETKFPESGGYKLYLTLDDGVAVLRNFPSGATSVLRGLLQDIVDLIEVA